MIKIFILGGVFGCDMPHQFVKNKEQCAMRLTVLLLSSLQGNRNTRRRLFSITPRITWCFLMKLPLLCALGILAMHQESSYCHWVTTDQLDWSCIHRPHLRSWRVATISERDFGSAECRLTNSSLLNWADSINGHLKDV